MPNISDCILEAVKAGTMSAKGAEEYKARMADKEAVAREQGMGAAETYLFATSEAAKDMEQRATSKRAQVQRTILTVDRDWEAAARNSKGVGYGLTDVFGVRIAGEGTGISIGQQQSGNLKVLQNVMAPLLSKIQSRAFGMKQDQILPRHTVSALFGRDVVDPAAKAAASAWDAGVTWWRDEMQRAGVFVRELKDWRLPQHWDPLAVKSRGKDAYIEQMDQWWRDGKLRLRDWQADGEASLVPTMQVQTPEEVRALRATIATKKKDLDKALSDISAAQSRPEMDAARKRADDIREAIKRDEETLSRRGGIGNERAQQIFERAYGNITTSGDASIEPGAQIHTSMADKFGRRRAFEWTSDDAWLEFNRTYGVGDDAIGELMSKHIDRMSRDLALAQVLGPDPDRTSQILLDMYSKQGGSPFWANKLKTMYEMQTGRAMMPVSQRLALGATAFRQYLTGAQLGGALLSSASDFGFTKSVANWYGLDMTRLMGDYVGNLKPRSLEDRAQALRSVSIQEVGLRGLHAVAQDVIGDIRGASGAMGKLDQGINAAARVSGRVAEVVIRAQGLAHHTQALRDAIGSQIMAHLHDLAPKPWAELSGIEKRLFSDYGLSTADWETIRTKGLNQGFVDPFKLSQQGEAVGAKLLGAIANIERVAVPEGNVITRALMLGNTRPGTIEGEFLRSFAQYRGFPMASFLMHYYRALDSLRDTEGQWFRGHYIASLVVSTTVLGALSIQLKNLAAGKDPEPMDGEHGPKFWAMAFAQGGAGGMIGDYLKAMFSAQRLDDPARMMTPTAGFGMDVGQLLLGNINASANDREGHTARQALKMLRKYTPGVWEMRLAVDRLVHDTLSKMYDPGSADTFARMQQQVQKQQQTNYYWRPGSSEPRAPDFGRMF